MATPIPALELTNQVFGKWTVLSPAPSVRGKHGKLRRYWNVRCACGAAGVVGVNALTMGRSSQCVACGRKASAAKHTRHGRSKTSQYAVWEGMIARCENPHHGSYHKYGGRGISVCAEWHDFTKFLADMGPSNGLTIERKDNDKGYSPENCRWATVLEQGRNTRRNVFLTHPADGRRLHHSGWAREFGIAPSSLQWALKRYGLVEAFKRCEARRKPPVS